MSRCSIFMQNCIRNGLTSLYSNLGQLKDVVMNNASVRFNKDPLPLSSLQ